MPNQTPIPTQINIAPSGMTWKNWKLVHGTDGFTTRETMEKYLCNPDRVRDLEECRDLNYRTIMQLEALIQLYEAQMEAVGAGGVEPLRKCNKLHQIAEPAAPVGKPIEDAIDALVMAAFTEGGCSEHRMSEARIQTELRKKELRTLLSTPQPCSRSHPHEEMTPMCELRTEIARLTNALARAEAQLAAAPQAVQADEKSQAAPCVTPADVEAAIASEHYYTGQIAAETESQHRALGGILNCTLVMKNGHLVSGEALLQDLSKPDPERAQASARRRAFDKAYDMVVYAERERLAATHPTQQGPEPIEQRQLAIGQAVERACKELPEGAEIQIYLERGAGTVNMTDWDGNEFDHFDEAHNDFACRINAATDGAIAAEQFAAQAKQGEQANG